MNNPRWLVLEKNGRFYLNVRVESEIRPQRELLWQGEIRISDNGGPSLPRMHLEGIEGEGSRPDEQPSASPGERVLRDLILDNCTNSGTLREIIRKVARACCQDTQRLEDVLAARAARDERATTRAEETARDLRELIELGTQQHQDETASAR